MAVDLRSIIRSMDLTIGEFIKEARVSKTTVYALQAGAEPSLPVRRKIEAAVDQAIWSTQEDFMEWREIRRLFGCEPYTLSGPELRKRTQRFGIRGRDAWAMSKEELISTLIARQRKIGWTWNDIAASPGWFPRTPKKSI